MLLVTVVPAGHRLFFQALRKTNVYRPQCPPSVDPTNPKIGCKNTEWNWMKLNKENFSVIKLCVPIMNRHERPQSPITIPIIYLVTEQTRQPITGPVKLSIILKQSKEIKQQTVTSTLSGAEKREKRMLKHQLKEQDVLLRRNTINVDSKNWGRWIEK